MMTLETISIEKNFQRPVSCQDGVPSEAIPPVASQPTRPAALERFLRRMTQEGLLGHELIVRFFANLRRNCRSEKTMTGYRTTLFGFMAFLKSNGKQHIETVTREDISAYVEHEQDRGMSPCTVNTRTRALYSFLQFFVDRDLVDPKVLTRKIRIKMPEALPRAIDPEDIRLLLAAIDSTRDRAMILVLLRTGMRIGELRHTTLEDLNLKEKRIEIYQAQKNRVGRVVYISDDARAALKRWLRYRPPKGPYVFCGQRGGPLAYETTRTLFNKCVEKAGLAHRGYTLHCLRHTFASELLNAGMRLECLQQLLGHSTIEMTRRYARLTDNTRKEEYFRAMRVIEKGGINGHYRDHHSLPQVSEAAQLLVAYD
jgi:integrase/recombinase XerD